MVPANCAIKDPFHDRDREAPLLPGSHEMRFALAINGECMFVDGDIAIWDYLRSVGTMLNDPRELGQPNKPGLYRMLVHVSKEGRIQRIVEMLA